MNFEPQKFFIGVIDFFSVIMPGALLAYLWKDDVAVAVLGRENLPLAGAETWMVFLFMAYLLGHIVFLLGSWLLDALYDWVRGCTYLGQIRRLADGRKFNSWITRVLASVLDRKKFPNWAMRALAYRLFDDNPDDPLIAAVKLRSQALGSIQADGAVNAFQWCKAKLSQQHLEGLVAVQRFEADSKFFRSFAIVLLIQAVVYGIQQKCFLVIGCVVLLVLTVWRYADQRFKSTQQAYWQVVTMESLQTATAAKPARKLQSTGLTHAGGVVFRDNNGAVEYLLVESTRTMRKKDEEKEWVLAKGHIEPGEGVKQTAVREVYEESGYWAEVGQWLDDVPLRDGSSVPLVRFFLMQFVRKAGKWPPEKRKHLWLPLQAAQDKATFVETKNLLKDAEEGRKIWGK